MKEKLIIILPILILIAVIYRFIQIIPHNVGTGETRESPNKAYQASAYDYASESFWGEKRYWFEFEIRNVKSDNIIQRLETTPITGPYFGSRSSHKVVHWSKDSKEVVFKFSAIDIKMKVKPEEYPIHL